MASAAGQARAARDMRAVGGHTAEQIGRILGVSRATVYRRLREPGPGDNNVTPGSRALLSPAQVTSMFQVHPATVARWGRTGKLSSVRTPGGHRRYYEDEVRAFLGRAPGPPLYPPGGS